MCIEFSGPRVIIGENAIWSNKERGRVPAIKFSANRIVQAIRLSIGNAQKQEASGAHIRTRCYGQLLVLALYAHFFFFSLYILYIFVLIHFIFRYYYYFVFHSCWTNVIIKGTHRQACIFDILFPIDRMTLFILNGCPFLF